MFLCVSVCTCVDCNSVPVLAVFTSMCACCFCLCRSVFLMAIIMFVVVLLWVCVDLVLSWLCVYVCGCFCLSTFLFVCLFMHVRIHARVTFIHNILFQSMPRARSGRTTENVARLAEICLHHRLWQRPH